MMQLAPSYSDATAALLKINNLNLLLPQSEVRTLESSTDIDPVAPALHSIGWIAYARKHWPAYCLSEDLLLMAELPAERRACALLALGAGYIGIMCDDMMILKNFSAQRFDIPQAMRGPDTPLLHLVTYEQGIACVSNAKQLTAYVEKLVSNTR